MTNSNTSATGGYLQPAALPIDDAELDNEIQKMVVGVTGIEGRYVRPRWQQEPGDLPGLDKTWCAIGVTETDPDTYASEVHNPVEPGSTQQQSHEGVTVLASFYGPNAQVMARMLARGLLIVQNMETLTASTGMVFVKANRPVEAPQMPKNRWINRIDVELMFRRQVDMTYPIRNVASASGQISNERLQVQFVVSE